MTTASSPSHLSPSIQPSTRFRSGPPALYTADQHPECAAPGYRRARVGAKEQTLILTGVISDLTSLKYRSWPILGDLSASPAVLPGPTTSRKNGAGDHGHRESSAMTRGGTFGYGIRPIERGRACFMKKSPVRLVQNGVEVSGSSLIRTAAARNP